MKKVAVVLSGCGFLDGSEITEAVSTLIALSEYGAEATCFAPNLEISAAGYLDHIGRGSAQVSIRNVLVESSRISRGVIQDLTSFREADFDAVVFPGGFGAAKVLSNWMPQGATAKVLPEVAAIIREFHRSAKPIGALCIAPVLLACVLGKEGINITIGNDSATAQEIEKTGAHHVRCEATDFVSDRDHKILTTPAYMIEAKPHEVFRGISKLIRELVEMA